MSNEVFPTTLKGLDIKITRTPVFKTAVQESVSGKELRASWWSTPRYKYTLDFNFLRQGLNSDEAETLRGFFARHLGSWDSFLLNDPYDSTQRRVRFDMDEITMQRLLADTVSSGGQTWEAKSVKLISVK